jgi:hypothetical protein
MIYGTDTDWGAIKGDILMPMTKAEQDSTVEQSTPIQGNGPSPDELAVAHGIATYGKVAQERDELAKQLDQAMKLITINKIEIEALRAERAVAVSRSESYRHERDLAVVSHADDTATLRTLFQSLLALMRQFEIEHAPLVVKESKTDEP